MTRLDLLQFRFEAVDGDMSLFSELIGIPVETIESWDDQYEMNEGVPGTEHVAAIRARWRVEDEMLRRSGQWQPPPSLIKLLKKMGRMILSFFVPS